METAASFFQWESQRDPRSSVAMCMVRPTMPNSGTPRMLTEAKVTEKAVVETSKSEKQYMTRVTQRQVGFWLQFSGAIAGSIYGLHSMGFI